MKALLTEGAALLTVDLFLFLGGVVSWVTLSTLAVRRCREGGWESRE